MRHLYLFATVLIVACAQLALAQDQQTQQLYPPGSFPPGRIYSQAQLASLVGQELSSPSYLIGHFAFLYKDAKSNQYVFTSFTVGAKHFTPTGTLVAVTFFNNVPPGLENVNNDTIATIVPTADQPLRIRSVWTDKGHLLVQAECWSTP